jgi:glycosyltransferase involved in cell wall biosynthesis
MVFVISLLVLVREGFDILHAHNPPDLFVFIAAFYKLFRKRFIFDHHDLAPEMYYARFKGQGNKFIYHLLVFLEKLSCRLADHVIVTNQSYKTVALERSAIPAARVTIVRNGPELERLQPVAPDPELRRKARTLIGYVGVMGFQDGIDYLLRAIKHLVEDFERRDIFCVLIGKGDAWDEMRTLATQLGIAEYVWFTGRISDADLMRYLSTVDICVDPDPCNPFNDRSTMIKMTEYMALGKPIVAFDLTEHRVTAREAALYARPNEEFDFARQIVWLIDHPEQRRAMGRAGRKRVETELAWSFQVQHLLAAYQNVETETAKRRSATTSSYDHY